MRLIASVGRSTASRRRGRRRSVRSRRTRLVTALVLLAGVLIALGGDTVAPPSRMPAFDADPFRTGWDANEPDLSASTVTGSNFGELFATHLRGQIYAQPLAVDGLVVANTEDNWAYGLDAVTGAIKWSRDFGPPWPASTNGCADLTPNIGSTSTATYDESTGTVYLTTKVSDGPDLDHPNWYLQAVDLRTGVERPGWPVRVVGTPANDPDHPFRAKDVNQRPGLLLMDGVVYLAFGSQCDYGTYVGWVAGVNVVTHAISLWSDEVGATSEGAGIWHGGGGIVSDGPGRLYVATGNGVTPPDSPGSPVPHQLSQSLIRLGVDRAGVISAKDFFSPWNASTLDHNDQDLGGGGPVALPDRYFGTPSVPHLMVEIGKEGRLYLLDRGHLGGKAQGPDGGDLVVQKLGPYHGVWGHPGVYGGEGGYVYVLQDYGTLLAFKYGVNGAGAPALTLVGNSAETFGYTSGSPMVTSDGTKPGTAVVWVTNVDGPAGTNGRLCAYDGVPSNGVVTLLRCFPIGVAAKFASPRAYRGRVYVGTRDGVLFGFGQPTTAALVSVQTGFAPVDVSRTATATVTVTATRTVTVTRVGTAAPFALTQPALPATLQPGQTMEIPATFTPSAPGSFTGWAAFSVIDRGRTGTLGAALQGTGVRPGFTSSSASLDYGQVPVGSTKSLTVSFTNTGQADEIVTGVSTPSAPFTVEGLPSGGAVVSPGRSIPLSVTYAPTRVGGDSSALRLSGPHGTAMVTLTATGVVGIAKLQISPPALRFTGIPVGLSATQTLTVANEGNLSLTLTKAAPPALPYVVDTPLPEGQVLNPGDVLHVDVTFTPTTAGSFNNFYTITADDGRGVHRVPVTATAFTPAGGIPLPNMLGGGWVYNGSARMAGRDLVLTTAAAQEAGSAVFSTPLPSSDLRATFTARLGGGNGADGMTFAMLAASANTPQSVGGLGGGLGFLGLPGVAVTLDTYREGQDPSSNFVGLSAGGGGGDSLAYVATATSVPNLRDGPHLVTVTVHAGVVTVSIDGVQVISKAIALPPSVLVAFTASTGGWFDTHAVGAVEIQSGSTTLPPPGTGWWFNGSAVPNGADVVLTPAQMQQAGSVLFTSPVGTDGLTASFNLTSGGGTGADGISFVLLDPHTAPTSVGGAGEGLGFGGLTGVAVAFLTYPEDGVNSFNWAGVATSGQGGLPRFVAVNTRIAPLRTGSHNVVIQVSGTTLTVSIDGVRVLRTQVASLSPTAVVGFTASTGRSTDVHSLRNVQILARGAAA